MRALRTRFQDEDGAALMLVALGLTGFILFLAFVIEGANWFIHKRHLQLQADAAALAGGTAFKVPNCDDAAIYAAIRNYAGVKDLAYTSPYNGQIGGTPDDKVHIRVNSTAYYNDGGIDYSDGGQPCEAGMVDVKMTESDLPWFLSNKFVPAINAHARVSFNQVDTVKGQLPIGVPDVNPHSAAVIFYDEATSNLLNVKYLTNLGPSGGLTTWTNTDTPASVTMPPSGHVGVVIALSTKGPPPTGATPMSISGTVSEICNQGRVDCYDATGTTVNGGILYIHGWENDPATGTPAPRAAILMDSTATCNDFPYGYYIYGVTGTCTVTLSQDYSWTPGAGQNATDIELRARGGGCGNNGCTQTNTGSPATFDIPIAAGSGRNPITVTWALRHGSLPGIPDCGNNFNNSNCTGSFGVVQRAFAGDDDVSGPLRVARLWNMGTSFTAGPWDCPTYPAWGAACHDLRKNQTYSLAVTIRLAGALTTSVTDPAVALRVVGRSQTGSIDCDQTGNLRIQIEKGCSVYYKINTDPAQSCAQFTPQNKTGLFNTPQPYVCVATQTGGSVGQFTQGIQARILGGSNVCPALPAYNGRNHWSDFGVDPNFPLWSDPRLILVFLVPFGSFRGTGNDLFPVTGIGEFYITGWGGNGGGNDDPCPGADPAPAGYLMGHFLNRPIDSSQGTGTGACDITSLIPCVSVLTK